MKVLAPPAKTVQSAADGSDSLCLPNLLNDFTTLRGLLEAELGAAAAASSASVRDAHPHLLDAFLLAAGMNQILDDYLHRDPFALTKVATHLGRVPAPVGPAAARTAREASIGLHQWRTIQPRTRKLIAWQRDLRAFVQQASDAVVAGLLLATEGRVAASEGAARRAEELARAGRDLLARVPDTSDELAGSVVRLPSAFRSFDQRPEDCRRVACDFAARWRDRAAPLLVVGIRTSGSYLAPLYAACLRRLGYRDVRALTMRPGQHWLPGETAELAAVAHASGRVLLADDPPASGDSVAKAARQLQQAGVPHAMITLLLPVFGEDAELPAALTEYDAIILPFAHWYIHERLLPIAVQETLASLLVGRQIQATSDAGISRTVSVDAVDGCERVALSVPLDDLTAVPHPRGHVRARYRVTLLDVEGERFTHEVYVKGIGLSYFGRYALSVARAVPEFLPETYGAYDGLLYRAWLPSAERSVSVSSAHVTTKRKAWEDLADRMAAYVAARRQALSLPEDISRRLKGRDPVWQKGAELLGQAFGGATPLVRPALQHLARRLLLAENSQPSVVDGSMSLGHWLSSQERPATPLKVDYDERAFCNRDHSCYDAAFDLASAAAALETWAAEGQAVAERLRQRYVLLTGVTIPDERWLLYQLVGLASDRWHIGWTFGSDGPGSALVPSDTVQRPAQETRTPADEHGQQHVQQTLLELERALARQHARYLGEQFCRDVTPPSSGPLCAIDIDGVLETGQLSYSATTPAGAGALRALVRHGYRPVLVTGRSLDEVRVRCAAYRLAGGVAEYGAAAYSHVTGEVRVTLRAEEQRCLAELRRVLRGMQGVFLDDAYRYAVRAYRLDEHGWRRGLAQDIVEAALERLHLRAYVRPIRGYEQTDFMAVRVDKATGIHALTELLDGPAATATEGALLAFAAGDSVSDLAMFSLAERAFAPANAEAAVRDRAAADRSSAHIMRQPYQAGLALAVTRLLGHSPGGCATCRPPRRSCEAELLLTALAAQDRRKWGKLWQGMLLAGRMALSEPRGRASRRKT